MLRRVALLAVPILALTLLLAACREESPTAAPLEVSFPPAATAAEVQAAATVVAMMWGGDGPDGPGCPTAEPASQDEGKAFPVNLEDPDGTGAYLFNPGQLDFKVGETVSFTLTAETEFHTFTVCDLGIDETVEAGQTSVISFKFNEPGVYELVCIPHESLGMVGTITVRQ